LFEKINNMKKLLAVSFLVLVAYQLVAQQVTKVVKDPSDTIVLISGRKVVAMVQGVTASRISYIPFDQKAVKEMDRKQVHKIYYRNGRVEHFNSLALQMIDEDSWQTVILTDKKEDIEGFFSLGQVDAQSSPQARNARAAQRSADIRLKKKAVNMGGIVVFITKRESRGGYGEIPTHSVEGVVYGFEPPVE
jgi:hypothetical protein